MESVMQVSDIMLTMAHVLSNIIIGWGSQLGKVYTFKQD